MDAVVISSLNSATQLISQDTYLQGGYKYISLTI